MRFLRTLFDRHGKHRRGLRALVAVSCALAAALPIAELASAQPAGACLFFTCNAPTAVPTVSIAADATNVTAGATITLTVTVSGNNGVPTGTVSITGTNGATNGVQCTDPSGSSSTCTLTAGSTQATATAGLSGLTAGIYQLTANYGGNTTYVSGSSSALSITVSSNAPIDSTTALATSTSQLSAGQSVNLTATVNDANGPVTSGTVKFVNVSAGTTLGTAPLQNGIAILTGATGWTTTGSYDLRAVFEGSARDNASNGDAWVSVTGPPPIVNTTTSVSIGPGQITVGGVVGLSATVIDANGAPVTYGIVKFVNVDAGTTLGTAILNGSGVATLGQVTGWTTAGNYNIQALFEGTATDSSSSAVGILPVIAGPTKTTTAVSVNPASVVAGQATPVTLSATVTAPPPSLGPTGTVEFFVDGQSVGTAPLTAGSATLQYSVNLTSGKHSVTAQYSGDPTNAASTSAAATLTAVTQVDTTTTGSANPSPQLAGKSVTLSAHVSSSAGSSDTPSGTVTFTSSALPGAMLCSATLSSGAASCATSFLPAGSDSVVATYSGDATHTASTGSFIAVVNLNPSTTTVSVNPTLASAGQSVTITANVTGADPTGTVTFTTGTTVLCSQVSLVAGTASCTTTSLLVLGPTSVNASYSGDADNATSSGAATVTVVPPTINCGQYWRPWYQPPTSVLNIWGNCEWFLYNWSNDWNAQTTPKSTAAALYSDEAALGTGTSAPVAVVQRNGVAYETLPVTISPQSSDNGHEAYYGTGSSDQNSASSRTIDLLTVTIPSDLQQGDVVELTVYDADGDVDQISWTVTIGDNHGNGNGNGNGDS